MGVTAITRVPERIGYSCHATRGNQAFLISYLLGPAAL